MLARPPRRGPRGRDPDSDRRSVEAAPRFSARLGGCKVEGGPLRPLRRSRPTRSSLRPLLHRHAEVAEVAKHNRELGERSLE